MRPQGATRGRQERRSIVIFTDFSPNGPQEALGGPPAGCRSSDSHGPLVGDPRRAILTYSSKVAKMLSTEWL